MFDEPARSRTARAAAERALIRVVHHYGARPEFVLVGGLVPDLLCASSRLQHAGTTDVDVQLDLEIAAGAMNARRLEQALRNAEFAPDGAHIWRWTNQLAATRIVIKFELLTDLDHAPAESTVTFAECDGLGAVNLRGTGFVTRDIEVHELRCTVGGIDQRAQVNVAGLAGFLLSKCAAARTRRKQKDWYDIAFVLLHNDLGGPRPAAEAVRRRFASELHAARGLLDDLLANFATPNAQGPQAYASQMRADHPDLEQRSLAADAVVAVDDFHNGVFPG